MLTLTGTLRQAGEITLKEKPYKKLWVEHESPGRDNGPGDLQILELLLPAEACTKLPEKGQPVSVAVRAYAAGRDIKFSALHLAGDTSKANPASGVSVTK